MALTYLKNLGIVANAGISTTKLGAGAVLQVVTATDSTSRSTTSTSFVTASNTLSVSITPSSTSNKILLIATTSFYYDSSIQWGRATIFKNGVNLKGSGSTDGFSYLYNGGSDIGSQLAINYLDSPSSTSSLTYQIYVRTATSGTIYLNVQAATGSITALEIKG